MMILLACADPVEEAPPAAPAPPDAPDIVLVGVAGLRGDVPSTAAAAFGAAFRPTVSFDAAYAQSTSGFTSWGSLLGGRYPSAIPLCGVPTGATSVPWCNRWPEAQPSLPQVLALYGYRTAFAAADLAGAEHLGALFQEVLDVDAPGVATDWSALGATARSWWDADASRPRLLVVATSDMLVQQRPDLLAATGLEGVGNGRGDVDRALRAYAEEAGRVGTGVAGLLDALPASRPRWAFAFGVYGQRLGEGAAPWHALGEDQPWSDILLDRTLRVPLVVTGPTPAATRDARVAELVDILPTVTRLAGAVAPASIPGADLLAPAGEPSWAYAEFGDMLAVRSGDRMYAVRGYFHYRSSLDPELTNFLLRPPTDDNKHYLNDVVRDAFQSNNLLPRDPIDAARMHALLVSIRNGIGAAPEGALDARHVYDLRTRPSQSYW